MLTVLGILAALVVLFVAASVATREGDLLLETPRDAADLDLPGGPLQPEDLATVRFGMAVRGYRMSEVDAVLDRVQAELSSRDARVHELEAEQQQPLPELSLHAAIDPTVAPVLEPPAYDEQPVAVTAPAERPEVDKTDSSYSREEAPADDAAFALPVAPAGQDLGHPGAGAVDEPSGGGPAAV